MLNSEVQRNEVEVEQIVQNDHVRIVPQSIAADNYENVQIVHPPKIIIHKLLIIHML
jgi:hypothetical protein